MDPLLILGGTAAGAYLLGKVSQGAQDAQGGASAAGGAQSLGNPLGAFLGGLTQSFVDPDAPLPNETTPQWANRVGLKYHNGPVSAVPAATRTAMIKWTQELWAAIHEAGKPAYNEQGIPCVYALPPPASQWAPPGFYNIVRRSAGEYQADLQRMIDGWSQPGYVAILTDTRCQRDWGFLGTGIPLGAVLGGAAAVVGSVFGPAGTAAGAAVGGIVGNAVRR